MMRKQSLVVVAAFLAVLCSSLPTHAQSLTGTITGRVLDQQGGALPGATVTVTGKTGSQSQVTDPRGEFRFVGLSVGTYSVLAELPGFSKREEQSLDLGIGNTIDLKLELKVSGVSEAVQVTASPITIDTSTTATDSKLSQSLCHRLTWGHCDLSVTRRQAGNRGRAASPQVSARRG